MPSLSPPGPPPPSVGACLIVRDEATQLADCLATLTGLDEIVVVDTGSTDETVAIAERFGAKVGHFAWCDDFAAARNASLALATTDWVLIIDADERLSEDGVQALRSTIADHGTADGILCPTIVNVDATGAPATLHPGGRLFARRAGHHFRGRIYEQPCRPDGEPLTPLLVSGWQIIHHGYAGRQRAIRFKPERNLPLLQARTADTPADPDAWYCLGQEYHALGMLQAADEAYETALRLVGDQPACGLIVTQLMSLSVVRGDGAKVLALDKRYRSHCLELPDYWLALGSTLAQAGELRAASEAFAMAIAIPPEVPVRHESAGARTWKPRAYLAQLAGFQGDWPGAYGQIVHLVPEEGNRRLVQVVYVQAALHTGRHEEAAAFCLALLERTAADADLPEVLAGILEQFPAGQRILHGFITVPAGFDPVARRLAAAGQWPALLALCEQRQGQVAGLDARWAGHALLQLDRLDEAEAALAQACEALPGHGQPWHDRGVIAQRRGDLPLAARHFHEVIRREPAAVPALLNLVAVARLRGDLETAEAWLARARAVAPVLPGLQALGVQA